MKTNKTSIAWRRRWQPIVGTAILLLGLAIGWPAWPTAGAETAALGDKAVIEKAIRASIGWAIAKDRPLLESLLVHDESLFIFNPDANSTVGWAQFKKGFDFWMDPRFRMEHYQIRNLRIDLSLSGTVAWWSCILDERASWDGRSVGWKDTRWTGVTEKRGGKWLIVQMHFSHASK